MIVLVDHASNEVWYDAARRMDRFAAADLREVCSERFGSVDRLGIARSPAFHYEPETNGCAEKAIQILKEQLLWIERFETLDELRTAVRRFGRAYNQHWLIERHGYRTPTEAREHLRAQAAATSTKWWWCRGSRGRQKDHMSPRCRSSPGRFR